MGFGLSEVDILLRPQAALRLGVLRIPAVEIDGRRLTGIPTSAELAAFIAGRADPPETVR
jgi:hypothetical protein